MKPRVKFALVTALVLLLFLFSSYWTESRAEDNQITRYYLVGFAIAAAFPIALVFFAASQRIDGFSFGAIFFAVLLEAFIYIGWAASPQEETDRYLYLATALPFTLIATTLLFNILQRDA